MGNAKFGTWAMVGALLWIGCSSEGEVATPGAAPREVPTQSFGLAGQSFTVQEIHTLASPIDRSVSTEVATSTAFLYSGTSPVQVGVAPGTILPTAAAVIRGHVYTATGTGLAGVTVTVVNHPEFGSTLTQSDGEYDLAVNGGQTLRLHYALASYLPAERLVKAPWQDYVTANDVALVPPSSAVTAVDVSGSSMTMQVARGTTSTDSSGTRRATLLVPMGTQATMTLPGGSTSPLTTMHVRATEYSVGTNGSTALPADLPATAAYSYSVELSADEALAAGATALAFSQPLPFYVEDFLSLPVGTSVPTGYYSSSAGSWLASGNGIILKIISATAGVANVDVTGDGVADTGAALTALGITSPELQSLATLYAVGQTLWRTPVGHFTPYNDGPNGGGGPTVPDVPLPCSAPALQTNCSKTGCGNTSFCGSGVTTWAGCLSNQPGDCYYFCCPKGYFLGTNQICSAYTCNAPDPPLPPPDGPGDCKKDHASTIGCQTQSLGEDLPLPGTPYSLHYQSDRQRGYVPQLTVPISEGTQGAPTGYVMRVNIAGELSTPTFSSNSGPVTTTVSWDGKDAYGRLIQGSQPVSVQIGYQYAGVYQSAPAFGLQGNATPITGTKTRLPFVQTKGWNSVMEHWDAQPEGLGGWSLNVHHAYDVTGRILRLGDGTNRTLRNVPPVIQTVAGNGSTGSGGDGGAAIAASVSAPQSVAVGGDGSIYIADGQSCIRRVGPDGIIQTVAGQCGSPGFSGDGTLATGAQLQGPESVKLAPDGTLYIADTANQRIRHVDSAGLIWTIAGSGLTGSSAGSFSGDGGPATQATLNNPTGVEVTSDGTLYVADRDNGRVRQVSPAGTIATIAGSGPSLTSTGTGAAATAALLGSPTKVCVGTDGSVYIAETSGNVVRRVGSEGLIHAVAGTGTAGYTADANPAGTAMITTPSEVACASDGSVYLVDNSFVVRQVSPRGLLTTIAGHSGQGFFSGDNGLASAATLGTSQGLVVAPDGAIYIASTADNRVRRVSPALPGFSGATNSFSIPSEDGHQVFLFDGNGRHLQTMDPLTGAAVYTFAYDGAGRLASVTDVDGNVTQINHDPSSGALTAIITPYGQQSTFSADANGYLASVTDPASQTTQFTYDSNGLLQTKLDARANTAHYTYNTIGRLTADKDTAGATTTLTQSNTTALSQVVVKSAMGLSRTLTTNQPYPGSFRRSNTTPSGAVASLMPGPTSTTVIQPGAAQVIVTTPTPDSRPGFGMLAPTNSITTTLPSGLATTQATSRSATYAGGSLATFTEEDTLNGNGWSHLFDVASQTWTTISPVSRQQTTTVDAAGRPTQIVVPNTSATSLTYDTHGRLATISQGSHTWTTAYDANGYPASLTDPLGNVTAYTNDAIGRPIVTTLADTRQIGAAYDPAGRVTQVTLPSTNGHAFAFTPVELLSTYTPPLLASGSTPTTYAYDLDRKPTTITRPDGGTITYAYDSYGNLASTTYPQGRLTTTYDATTGHLNSTTSATGETTAFTYDGVLLTKAVSSGVVPGTLLMGYDNNRRMVSQSVNGTALTFGYDLDGLLTNAGMITLSLGPQDGRISGTTLGAVTDSYGYDSNGLFAAYTAAYNGSALYSETVLRDAAGRITQKTEMVQGTTHVWGYTYDQTGRLTDVTEDGQFYSHYGYDADDNRTTYQNVNGTVNPTYDAQDRLLTYGRATYAYTLNGELTSKTVGSQVTNYGYDALGNLLSVTPPTGSAIGYVADGKNRRVGKKVGGSLTTGFLYQDALSVVAQLNGSGTLVARYVFGSKPNVPDYYTTSTGTFRILSDHLGSPRLIVNTSSGAVVEQIDYDEFGNVTNDTSPGLTPFGFAGGLFDKDTGLLRFGARDYDANVGRWVNKDPLRFGGGNLSLYAYVGNDPVNSTDPTGMINRSDCELITVGACAVGSVVCFVTVGKYIPGGLGAGACTLGGLGCAIFFDNYLCKKRFPPDDPDPDNNAGPLTCN